MGLFLAQSACAGDSTVPEPPLTEAPVVYRLVAANDLPWAARTTIVLGDGPGISGLAACNSYAGPLIATPPAFGVGPIRATRMACPDLSAEQDYFQLLGRMTRIEREGNGLILSNSDGETLRFEVGQD